ncbi:MAG: helix-turn-helix transcriptional regulator [Candidatus Omnitrophica bacterium]|nr:helix-turn-helix transcriptional regulator [Candidatus Omnitrophota bacterium]
MRKKERKRKTIVPESISQHVEEEYKRSPEFRKAYDEEVLKLKIAYKIIQLRKLRHLSQGELARKIGTTQQNISRLEDSANAQITIHTLTRLAKALRARLMVDLVPQE